MYDFLVLMLLVIAFTGAVGYVRACDSLTRTEALAKERSQ